MKARIAGFTLAELLIALLILGVIATFTIPKVLQSQQNTQHRATAKEAAGMLSGAYEAYRSTNVPPSNMLPDVLTTYMNYVRYDTGGTVIDLEPGRTTLACSAADPCLVMHNGARLMMGAPILVARPALILSGFI